MGKRLTAHKITHLCAGDTVKLSKALDVEKLCFTDSALLEMQ